MHVFCPASAKVPGAHVVQVVAPLSSALVPTGQALHRLAPAVAMNVPGAHAVHDPAPERLIEPGAHGAHAVAPASANVPAPHEVQAAEPLTENEPGLQAPQVAAPAPLNWPAAHGVQAADEGGAKDPALHAAHDALPAVLANEPASHAKQRGEPAGLKVPTPHSPHDLTPASLVEPGAQGKQPPSTPKVPAAQATHEVPELVCPGGHVNVAVPEKMKPDGVRPGPSRFTTVAVMTTSAPGPKVTLPGVPVEFCVLGHAGAGVLVWLSQANRVVVPCAMVSESTRLSAVKPANAMAPPVAPLPATTVRYS